MKQGARSVGLNTNREKCHIQSITGDGKDIVCSKETVNTCGQTLAMLFSALFKLGELCFFLQG